jgi:hypothetical protein
MNIMSQKLKIKTNAKVSNFECQIKRSKTKRSFKKPKNQALRFLRFYIREWVLLDGESPNISTV